MRAPIFALVLALMSAGANAQPRSAAIFGTDGFIAVDWDAIAQCAREPIRFPSDNVKSMLHPEWTRYEQNYRRISQCRITLISYLEGLKTAQPWARLPYSGIRMTMPGDGRAGR